MAGVRLIARISVLAGDVGRQAEPGSSVRATVADRHPGPALLGGGEQRRLVDDADGSAAAGRR